MLVAIDRKIRRALQLIENLEQCKQNTIKHPYRPFHPLERSSGGPKPTQ